MDEQNTERRNLIDQIEDLEAQKTQVRLKYDGYRTDAADELEKTVDALNSDFEQARNGWAIMEDAEIEDLAMQADDMERRLDDLRTESTGE